LDYKLTFDPPEIRDYDSPDYRKPVYILHAGRRIGYYQFTHENCSTRKLATGCNSTQARSRAMFR